MPSWICASTGIPGNGEAEAGLLRTLAALKADGCTVVVVTHRPSLVGGVDRVLLLRGGAVEAFGPRAEVLRRLAPPRPPRPAAVAPAPLPAAAAA